MRGTTTEAQGSVPGNQSILRIAFIASASLFLATFDTLLNGPSASSVFANIYTASVGINVVVLSFLGYLVGGLVILTLPRFFEAHVRITIYCSMAVFLGTLLLRFLVADSNPMVGVVGVFVAGLMLPLSKFMVYYCLSIPRNVAIFVLGTAFGQVGKIILLTMLNGASPAGQTAIFATSAVVCLLALAAFLATLPHVTAPDTSDHIVKQGVSWFSLIGQLIIITIITALFRAFRTSGSFPTTAEGIIIEVLVMILIPFACWKIFLQGEGARGANPFREALILLILGLFAVMGQSSETWLFSAQTTRQMVNFFEAFAQVVCWTMLFSSLWVLHDKPFRLMGIGILTWCCTSILWVLFLRSMSSFSMTLMAGLIYLCVLALDRFFPNVQVSSQPRHVDTTRELLRNLAAEHDLSDRETEVFLLLAQGRSRAAIASALYLSDGTVKSYASRIYHKFDVTGKDELLAKVQQLNDAGEKE